MKPKRKPPNGQYIRRTCTSGNIQENVITWQQMRAIQPDDVDLHYNEATGQIVIKPQKGKVIEYFGSIPGVGRIGWLLIEELMWSPSEFLTLVELYKRTNNESFASATGVASLLRRIRKSFGESGKNPWFFWTRKKSYYAICWHIDRSWRIVERLAESQESAVEQ